MRQCSFCGSNAEEEDRFCGKCGAELLDRQAAQARRETVPVISVAEVHRRLGRVYYRQGNPEGAIASWTRALEIDPQDEETRTLLASVRRELRTE